MKSFLLTLALCAGMQLSLFATHVRGGYIRAVGHSSDGLTFKVEVVAFTDYSSAVPFGSGEISFGDGTVIPLSAGSETAAQHLDGRTSHTTISFTHTYPAYGAYTIEVREQNRNPGVLNIMSSVAVPFYIETTVFVSPETGNNTTPRLITDPAIFSTPGERFYSSFACRDAEGDSLVYSLAMPKQVFAAADGNAANTLVFKWPNAKDFYINPQDFKAPALSMDKLSGQLIWDTPLIEGEFALAYKVLEYRRTGAEWVRISETLIDVQLINTEINAEQPGVELNYSFSADGRLDFTVEYGGEDSIAWFFYSDIAAVIEGEHLPGKSIAGRVADGIALSGSIQTVVSSEKPIIILAEATTIGLAPNAKTIRSYAIHPAGKEYVLTSVNNAESDGVAVYPNPATSVLNLYVQNENLGRHLDVLVLSLSGQSILKSGVPLSGKLATLNIEGIPAGIYLIKISQNDKTYLTKFVKN